MFALPKGTMIGTYCEGDALMGTYSDGQGRCYQECISADHSACRAVSTPKFDLSTINQVLDRAWKNHQHATNLLDEDWEQRVTDFVALKFPANHISEKSQ